MEYIYETSGVCATHIKFDINGDTITNVEFFGGCDGNLKAIPKLIDGWSVDEIVSKCEGITCGRKCTSCCDQLSKAVKQARADA